MRESGRAPSARTALRMALSSIGVRTCAIRSALVQSRVAMVDRFFFAVDFLNERLSHRLVRESECVPVSRRTTRMNSASDVSS